MQKYKREKIVWSLLHVFLFLGALRTTSWVLLYFHYFLRSQTFLQPISPNLCNSVLSPAGFLLFHLHVHGIKAFISRVSSFVFIFHVSRSVETWLQSSSNPYRQHFSCFGLLKCRCPDVSPRLEQGARFISERVLHLHQTLGLKLQQHKEPLLVQHPFCPRLTFPLSVHRSTKAVFLSCVCVSLGQAARWLSPSCVPLRPRGGNNRPALMRSSSIFPAAPGSPPSLQELPLEEVCVTLAREIWGSNWRKFDEVPLPVW